MHTWELQLLGALVLRREEEHITHFPTEKAGLLLAYLAAFPSEVHTREALTERFWPDSVSEAGRVSLRQALASLRRLLEPPGIPAGTILQADRSQLRLNPDFFLTDLAIWDRTRTRAAQASALSERLHWLKETTRCYGGIFLPGAYMEWALEERHRRQEQYMEVMLQLTEAQAELGDYPAAIASAQQMLQTDPLYEEAYALIMRLLAEQGKPGMARRHYQKLCRLLRDELDTAPSLKIQTLAAQLDKIARNKSGAAPSPTSGALLFVPDTEALFAPLADTRPQFPTPLTRFFGRPEELDLLRAWLDDTDIRLITLTGMGGVGKTRLALEAVQRMARQHTTRFGTAITFIALSEIQDPDLLLPTILQALDMPAIAPTDPFTRLAMVLGMRPALLILDNFEQLAEVAAANLLRLMEEVPNVSCLVTSRQALNLSGERELALAPLPVPAPQQQPQHLIENPTVQMLVDRMRARRPDFQVTSRNAATVTALCIRLEGIPLAVELAAGWARDLTVSQIQERLAHRFDLLISRQRGVPQRHQSLRAAIETSYQFLPAVLQRFFLRLSVFRGGWQEEMAEIASDPSDPTNAISVVAHAEMLRVLREHSLITAGETGERMRYKMLETLRAYGQEMLIAQETQAAAARHADWFQTFARAAAAHLRGPEQARWLDRLEEEQDNLRAALEYGALHAPLVGLRLANSLYWFWYVRGYFREGEKWLALLLERASDAPQSERAWGLLAAGHFANCQSNNLLAVSHYHAAKRLFEEIGDPVGTAHTLCRLGNAAQEMLDLETGVRLCAESVARFRALNDPSGLLLALFYYANSLLGSAAHNPHDFSKFNMTEAKTCHEEAFGLAETLGDLRFLSLILHCLCGLRRLTGDISGALQGYHQALQWQRVLRDPLLLSSMLRELSFLTAVQGDATLAAILYGAMCGLRQRIGYPTPAHEQSLLSELEVLIQTGMGATDYTQAFEAGRTLDFEQCLALALEAAAKPGIEN